MTYDHELTLIRETVLRDESGMETGSEETRRTILCNVRSAYRRERSDSGREGYKGAYVFTVHKWEYQNEGVAEFQGRRYVITNVYSDNTEEAELTASSALGAGSYE